MVMPVSALINDRRRREVARRLGLCTNKGCKNKNDSGFAWCKSCREKSRLRHYRNRQKKNK